MGIRAHMGQGAAQGTHWSRGRVDLAEAHNSACGEVKVPGKSRDREP